MRRLTLFLRLFLWFSLRQVVRHRLRAVTVLVGIALGAAVFTSVRLSVRASLDAFNESMQMLAGTADATISRPGGRVPEGIVETLIHSPSIGSLSPFSSVYVREGTFGDDAFLLIGIDPLLDREFRNWQVGAGTDAEAWIDLIAEPFSLIVGRDLALERGWSAGKRVTIVHARQTAEFRILAILDTRGLARVEGGRVAIADISTFQEFSRTVGDLDRIDIRLAPAAGASWSEDLQRRLPAGTKISPASAARQSGRAMIESYQLNLSVLSFASLFVGMFLVYSLVALNAASRRREIAVLRSIGASKWNVFSLFLAEGGIYGLTGWLLAIPVGGFLIHYLLDGVSRTISDLFMRVVVRGVDLSPWEIAVSLTVTVGISLLAALQPASEAMAVAPAEAVHAQPTERADRAVPRRLAISGLLAIAAALPISSLPAIGGVPVAGYLSMLVLFAGFSLLAPWGIRRFGTSAAPLLRSIGGLPAFLAGRYVRDTGSRTAISVGALITAVALYSALVIMIHSFRNTVELWVEQTISGDFFLTTPNAEVNQIWEPFTETEMQGLREIAREAGADIVPSRRFSLSYGDIPYQIDFLDLRVFDRHGSFVWLEGDPEQVMPALIEGKGVLVSEVFANRADRSVGDLFSAEVDGNRLEYPILGVVRDYRTRGGVVFGAIDALGRQFGKLAWGGARFYFPTAPHGVQAAVDDLQRRIEERFGDRFDMIAGWRLRASVLDIFDETFAVTGVLLLIALAVAALGIATTMTVLVLERVRQINTLLAVGGSRGQVRRMIMWEAVLIVLAGELAGLICGFLLSYLLVYVINRQSFGWSFLYGVDWPALAMSLPLILTTSLAAALPAVAAAFRLPPALALRE